MSIGVHDAFSSKFYVGSGLNAGRALARLRLWFLANASVFFALRRARDCKNIPAKSQKNGPGPFREP